MDYIIKYCKTFLDINTSLGYFGIPIGTNSFLYGYYISLLARLSQVAFKVKLDQLVFTSMGCVKEVEMEWKQGIRYPDEYNI